jgi:chitin disaccharide deacetylase
MVHMADSERAAQLARERGRPIGLHLNLTQPFDGGDARAPARERQLRLCAHFARLRARRWLGSPNPAIHRLVADAIRDQLEEYERLYDAPPTHVDSHHHVHVCPDVFLSPALASGTKVRQTVSPRPGARGPAVVARRLKHRLLARRFCTTDLFWGATETSGADGAVPIATAASQARSRAVEVMVHPSFPGELEVLLSDLWRAALAGAPLGSYEQL